MSEEMNPTPQEDMPVQQPVDEEMTAHETAPETPTESFQPGKILMWIIAAVGLIAAIGLAVYFFVGGNGANWVQTVKPVAVVNGERISYAEFEEDYQALQYYFANAEANGIPLGAVPPDDATLQQSVLDQLINLTLVEQLAAQYDLSVSDIEIEQEWQQNILPEFASEEEAIQTIEQVYGMSVAELKERVIATNILQEKVAAAVAVDPELRDATRQRAQEAYAAAMAEGADFAAVAGVWSEDELTAADGGQLDWFGRGEFSQIPDFEETAFTLEPGEISELFETQYGYHIIKVEEKQAAEGETPEQVRVRHILINFPTLATQLQTARDTGDVQIYYEPSA